MLHSLHLETPCFTKICGWTSAPVIIGFLLTLFVTAIGDVVFEMGNGTLWFAVMFSVNSSNKCCDVACAFKTAATAFESGMRAEFNNSLAKSGRRMVDACALDWFKWRLDDNELGDIVKMPRGLHEFRFGDGVNGGLPGNDGAHTICSGDTELLLFNKTFSFPSFRASIFIRCKSPDTDDEIDVERSLYARSMENRRTDRSNGVVLPSLLNQITAVKLHSRIEIIFNLPSMWFFSFNGFGSFDVILTSIRVVRVRTGFCNRCLCSRWCWFARCRNGYGLGDRL